MKRRQPRPSNLHLHLITVACNSRHRSSSGYNAADRLLRGRLSCCSSHAQSHLQHSILLTVIMSFDRLSSLESQPTTTRRQDDPQYRDDPEFQRFTESLSEKLFELISNVSRLSNQIALLGTKRDTERVRERVHDLLEETRDGFKQVGEGIKKAQAWDDLNVR
jgi:hypothetical protein